MEPGDQETKSLIKALREPGLPLISADPASANGTIRKLLEMNTILSLEAQRRAEAGEAAAQTAASRMTSMT